MFSIHIRSTILFLAILLTTTAANPALPARATNFTNPVLWQDYPDLDVFRVGHVFYYSSSTFAYSPGAPVLKSYDLVHWTPVTHSVPLLSSFGARYSLNGSGNGYVKGIWASTLRYRASNDMFYWMGCIENRQTHIFTAAGTTAGAHAGEVPAGRWNWTAQPPINTCYYDSGLLIDSDDDTMYVVYGSPSIHIAQLSPDGLRQVSTQQVYTPPPGTTLEGARLYKTRGTYYILATRPADAEVVLKSAGGPLGPYTARALVTRVAGPLPAGTPAGFAHQGGMVDAPDGRWWYVAFLDAYPGGRIPVVAPLRWSADGWPEVVLDAAGRWGGEYPTPVETDRTVGGVGGTDLFEGGALGEGWEWNHDPEGTRWRMAEGGGLVLGTADVTGDLFAARNTLTQRIVGPKAVGTFRLDVSAMRDGDRAGAVLFRDRAAYVGVWKEGAAARVVMVRDLTLAEGTWSTLAEGTVAAAGPTLAGGEDVWLRIEADITPAFGTSTERRAAFSYSVDGGKNFVGLGPGAALSNSWRYFSGYRFGVFNHATKELGGEVKVKSFTMENAS
ncbi:glycosyl hydrolase [Lasiosphaeris hirsuta]|uniref:Glycosyl hydrolase n=1 Tax=Lasiosphaeris hirsuta TaxID=260670 RepID=A0AA40A3H1_9PEZI|nr:glycosyl hydrolase [Lasiosphaeris hirsuta]